MESLEGQQIRQGLVKQALAGDRAGTGWILWSFRQVMMRTMTAATSSSTYALGSCSALSTS